MFRTKAAMVLVTTALMSGTALAQMNAAPAMSGTTGKFVTEQTTGDFRASKFVGLDIYGSENQKVGDIKEILIDGNGHAKAIVVGVGGFLGLGEKNVAVPWSAVEWKMDRAVTTAAVNDPAARPVPADRPAGAAPMAGNATGSTMAGRSPADMAAYNGYPDHGMIKMTRDDLKNAPEFKYYSDKK